jgi:hypothetical protein
MFHGKGKHIDTPYHFIRELVNDGNIMLYFCGSKEQLIEIFTKPLGINIFEFQRQFRSYRNSTYNFRDNFGVIEIAPTISEL